MSGLRAVSITSAGAAAWRLFMIVFVSSSVSESKGHLVNQPNAIKVLRPKATAPRSLSSVALEDLSSSDEMLPTHPHSRDT